MGLDGTPRLKSQLVGNCRDKTKKSVAWDLEEGPHPGEEDDAFRNDELELEEYGTEDLADALLWKFTSAIDNHDALKLRSALQSEEQMVQEGQLEYCLPEEEKAKQLALAMLGGDEAWYDAVHPYTSVDAADGWLVSTQPQTRCDCDDGHRGSLLVRVARAGRRNMVARCLEGALDPDACICDGETLRMYWSGEDSGNAEEDLNSAYDENGRRSGLGQIRLDAEFSKTTPLTAAAARGDTRMLELLLSYGADPLAHDMACFQVAARYGHTHFLRALLSSERIAEQPTVVGRACVVALKAASIADQSRTMQWLLNKLHQLEDWKVVAHSKVPRPGSVTGLGSLLQRPKSMGAMLSRKVSETLRRASEQKRLGSAVAGAAASFAESATASMGSRHDSRSNPRFAEPASFSRRQVVRQALDKVLDEMVDYAKQPGAALRETITGGIQRVLDLQREQNLATDLDPRRLMQVYLGATKDNHVFTSEDLANKVFSIGLGDYLAASKKRDGDADADADAADNKRMAAKAKTKTSIFASIKSAFSSSAGGSLKSMTRKSRVSDETVERDRLAVMLGAAHLGHVAVLEQLMPACPNKSLGLLLAKAVECFQSEAVDYLLGVIQERKRLSMQDKNRAVLPREDEILVDCAVLTEALLQALVVGNLAAAEILLGKGARASNLEIVGALSRIAALGDKESNKSIPFALQLASDNKDEGPITSSQLAVILTAALKASLNEDEPEGFQDVANRKAIKAILHRAEGTYATADHVVLCVRRSQGTREEDWRYITELVLRNFLHGDSHSDQSARLAALKSVLAQAENTPNVHVGVLTLLASMSEPAPRRSSSAASDDDETDSRWL